LRKGSSQPEEDKVVIENSRQRETLIRASEALGESIRLVQAAVPLDIVAIELNEALEALGSLTGEVTSADVLEHIFSGFCVGK